MSIWFSTSLKYDLNLLKFLSPMLPEESKINTTSAGSLQPVHSQKYTGYILILSTYQMIKGLTEKALVMSNLLITVRNSSCGKLMFLHLSVSVHRGCVTGTLLGRHTLADTPLGKPPYSRQTPLDRHLP